MTSELQYEQRDVPGSALQFNIGEFSLGDNGDGAKTAPIRLMARAGQPIDHPYWGKVVHDFEGMQHKKRIPIDYRHDEPIGYVNKFNSDSGNLELAGALVPFKDSDRATEIIHKSKNGVPYEASIDFRAPVVMEEVAAGQFAEVNGNRVDGPATVIRQWTLRGVAVCPYGADPNTSSQLSNAETFSVSVQKREPEMATIRNSALEAPKAVDSQLSDPPVEETPVADAPATEPALAEPVPAQQATAEPDGKAFIAAFGAEGAVWFIEGKSFADASQLHSKKLADELAVLRDENAQLKQKISAANLGETEAIQFTSGDKAKGPKGWAGMFAEQDKE